MHSVCPTQSEPDLASHRYHPDHKGPLEATEGSQKKPQNEKAFTDLRVGFKVGDMWEWVVEGAGGVDWIDRCGLLRWLKYTTRIRYGDVAIAPAVPSQTHHINVVRFLGLCRKEDKPVLVFEYISNGTLFEHIHKLKPTALLLSLELRLKIASETSGALAYLHSFTPAPIIHQCLATKYILLDDHYKAKLSAIGQSRLFNEPYLSSDYISSISKEGYFDPHFRKEGLAEKSDVYSFGVVLAELLTSQKPVSPPGTSAVNLASLFRTSVEEGRLDQILDAQIIVNEATSETAKKVADLAKRCLGLQRKARPSMEQVAVELEGLRKFMAEYQRGEDVEPSFS
ncbi:wall-associated receptor kinase 4-like [Prunus avium]|uniref:Wall-associated receptor kinase 4-like n=1 Tax=Prunus avium TaxID=42229 RepID=A0A6P5TVS5_PRUAV|nr:wall-associated receptor kinase 4-like [Prunus avium]